jgi:S-adenosylmethionine synthetase
MSKYLFSSESVGEGHPDKVCDQISDAVLDAYLKEDRESRVAVECFVKNDLLVIGGEITSKAEIDNREIEKIARGVILDIGYDDDKYGFNGNNCKIEIVLSKQSPDIAQGVNETTDSGEKKEQGAGDQGLMFGYATNETPELMPLPIILSHKLLIKLNELRVRGKKNKLSNVRGDDGFNDEGNKVNDVDVGANNKDNGLGYLRPDAKCQVTIEYENDKPKRAHTIVLSTQHDEKVVYEQLKKDIIDKVIKPVCSKWIDNDTIFHINPTGRFVIGGPAGDTGLTGRKIIVDSYGGMGRHGGGCFSGKDPSKVDRSAAYTARYIAKNIVASGKADRCEVQLAYAIGVASPVSLYVNCFGTNKIPEDEITDYVRKNFPLKPSDIIRELDLKRPIYQKTACYGHFGRDEFSWEKIVKL